MIKKESFVACLITTGSEKRNAAMCAIAASALACHSPKIPAILIGTREAIELLRKYISLNTFSECFVKEAPVGPAVWQNRWLKTQLGGCIGGSFVYLDNDVIVRRGFDTIFDKLRAEDADVGLAIDWNDSCKSHSIRRAKEENYWPEIKDLDWTVPEDGYCNGGVIASRGSAGSVNFFNTWHQLWLRSADTGIYRDQPALNHAISISGVRRSIIDARFNSVVHELAPTNALAHAFHFFCSLKQTQRTLLDEVLEDTLEAEKVNPKLLRRLMTSKDPWAESCSITENLVRWELSRAIYLGTRLIFHVARKRRKKV